MARGLNICNRVFVKLNMVHSRSPHLEPLSRQDPGNARSLCMESDCKTPRAGNAATTRQMHCTLAQHILCWVVYVNLPPQEKTGLLDEQSPGADSWQTGLALG